MGGRWMGVDSLSATQLLLGTAGTALNVNLDTRCVQVLQYVSSRGRVVRHSLYAIVAKASD